MRGACVPSICWRDRGNPGRYAHQQIRVLPWISCAAAFPAFAMLPAARVLHLIEFQSHCAGHAGLPRWALPKIKAHTVSTRPARCRPDSGAPHGSPTRGDHPGVLGPRRPGPAGLGSLRVRVRCGAARPIANAMMTLFLWAVRGQVEPGSGST